MRGIDKLIPEARAEAESFLQQCNYWGLNILITDTLRTKEEQDALYAQGRTASGNIVTSCKYPYSMHNWGCAWDFCRNVKGKEYYDGDGFFEKVGQIAEDMGLTWGGNFRKPDRPHIQLRKYAPDKTAKWLIDKYGTPDKFLSTQNAQEGKMTANELLNLITPEIAAEIVLRANKHIAELPPKSDEEAVAMMWAANQDIYHGDENGNLMPQKPLTRAEYAMIQLRLKNRVSKP